MSGDISMGVYVRELCRAIDALHDFAGTVAGGASWWDDVWAGHEAAIDAARAAIAAQQPEQQPVYVRPDELQKARVAPFLCRVEPTQRRDLVPLYASPQAPQAVPAGFVLAPVQPTPEMIEAGNDVEDLYRRGTPQTWAKVYRAMLAARPQAEQPKDTPT